MKANIKRIASIMLVVAMIFAFTACKDKTTSNNATNGDNPNNEQGNDDSNNDKDADDSDNSQDETMPNEAWLTSGTFVRDDSSQYNNAVLQLKYLSNNCVMFEFRLMEGDESEDSAETLTIPAVFVIDEDNIGRYESLPDSESPFKIEFSMLNADGKSVAVTHQGDIEISPDGVYTFVDKGLEVSETSAISILEHLPTAATSLNHNNGEYIIQYPEALVANWFYPVQAVFKDDPDTVIAKFLIAKDLSVVYRADDDIEPVLIFGSAQPMMEAEYIPFESDPPEDAEDIVVTDYLVPIVDVMVEQGVHLMVGDETKFLVSMPWELQYTIEGVKSSDSSIIEVDENGNIKANAVGEATISGKIIIDDGEKEFLIEMTVTDPDDYDYPDGEDKTTDSDGE
jgi:hypothetical protein